MREIGIFFTATLLEALRKRILLAALLLGAGFLLVFGIGFSFVFRETSADPSFPMAHRALLYTYLTLAGLYATHFLVSMTAAFLPVDTISGEITSGVAQTVVSKPIRRSSVVLGKWLAYCVVLAGYLALLGGGVLLVARVIGGITPPGVPHGLSLMLLEGTVLLTVSVAGGTRLTTLATGMTVFGLFGIAFLGGWIEQIATFMGNETARYVGTVASLVLPTEALWQRAAYVMQPSVLRDLTMTPFSPASVPSAAMVWWALLHVSCVLGLAVRWYSRREL